MCNVRKVLPSAVLLFTVLAGLTGSARAQDAIDQKAVDRAKEFLKAADRGRNVMSYVHFGAQYKGHDLAKKDPLRSVIGKPGHFALVYTFNWENDGITNLAFLCDAKGNFYEVQLMYSNAELQQPWFWANASINVVGNVILQNFKNQMTPQQVKQAQKFIDNPNAKGLLEMSLQLQQAIGK